MNKLAAEKLTEARKAKGYTQENMADLIRKSLGQGYSVRQYQKLEEGNFPKYKKEIVLSIDKILGSRLNELIYEQNVPTGNSVTWNATEENKSEAGNSNLSTLIQNNTSLVRAIEVAQENNGKALDTLAKCQEDQRELIQMLKASQTASSSPSPERQIEEAALTKVVFDLLVGLGVKTGFYKNDVRGREDVSKRIEDAGKQIIESVGRGTLVHKS